MQLTVPFKSIEALDLKELSGKGFTTIDVLRIEKMLTMREAPTCSEKRNVCGLKAGIRAGFVLEPQEIFYREEDFLDAAEYQRLVNEYPIMKPTGLNDYDLGLLAETLAAFWSRVYKYHNAQSLGFDNVQELIDKSKAELKDGRPVLLQVRISAPGFPLYLPDSHLGARGFHNGHWVVLLGFSEKEWLISDNGGLSGTLKPDGSAPYLLTISNDSLKKIANLSTLSEDVKQYLDEPTLPVYLDDWDNSDNDEQLRKDFRLMRPYNLVVLSKK